LPINSEVLWYNLQNNPRFFIESLLFIKDKKRKIILFEFNKAQLKIYREYERLRRERKPVRIFVLKSRQTGVSTLTQGLIFQDTTVHDNVNSMIIAHDRESTGHLYKMSQLFHSRLDKDIYKPMVRRENKYELLFENPNSKLRDTKPGLNSLIRVDTANNLQAGRAFTIQNLHCSEIAFWEKPEEVMTGLMQSVPEIPESMIIIETTANGVGNYAYSLWKSAEKGENDFVPIFIAWFEDGECRLPTPKDFKPYDYKHEIFGNEEKLKDIFSLDDEQIYWRRYTIKNKLNGDIDKFHQEYPSTPDEAFLVSGSNVFDRFLITKYYQNIEVREKSKELIVERGELEEKFDFIENLRGDFRIWKKPEKGNRYAIGVDVAGGISGGDYSCAEVFDKKNFEQVAEWHGKIPPDKFAYKLKTLAQYYNEAIVVVESNVQGLVTLTYLRPMWYRIYYRKEIDKRYNRTTKQMGFRTTGKSKPILLGDFNKLFREEELILNSKELLGEMSSYVEEEGGKTHPVKKSKTKIQKTNVYDSSYFDDRIIASCLAVQGLKITYLEKNKPLKDGLRVNNPVTGY